MTSAFDMIFQKFYTLIRRGKVGVLREHYDGENYELPIASPVDDPYFALAHILLNQTKQKFDKRVRNEALDLFCYALAMDDEIEVVELKDESTVYRIP